MTTIPTKIFLTKGVGIHKEKLASFESALRKAGIAMFNLVRVSSILPPNAKLISREKGLKALSPGQIIHCVLSSAETNEPGRLLSASIGIAVPSNQNDYGYISEHHAFGQTERVCGDYAEDLAASMLASTLGIPFDLDQAYDERREIYQMSKKIVRSKSSTQSAKADKNGRWTTVVAAAVMMD